jgi:beta-phosphoglucomutase
VPKRPPIEAVAFDFNGTLSDDEPILARIYVELFAELGRPITEAEYYEQLAGRTDEEVLARWFGESEHAIVAERIGRYNDVVADGSTVDADMRAAVRYAAERVPVALVSAARRFEIEPVLIASGLLEVFDVVVSNDDVARGKPDPEGYLLAADRLGVPPEALLVLEDTGVGVAAAKAAGCYVVGLSRTLGAAPLSGADELVDRIDVPLMERLLPVHATPG